MTLLDIAQSMKGRLRDGYSPSQAGVTVEDGAVEYGTAVSDSSGGFVTILMDGAPIYDPGYIESDYTFTVPVDAPVTNGDRVAYISQDGQGKAVALSSLTVLAENADTAASEAQAVANAVNQHFWDDANGAHVTEVEQDSWNDPDSADYHTGRDITLNSNGILLREDYNTLASFTPSAVAFYDGQGDAAENVTATFGNSGALIGKSGEWQTGISSSSISMLLADAAVVDIYGDDLATWSDDALHVIMPDAVPASGSVSVTVDNVPGSVTLPATAYLLFANPTIEWESIGRAAAMLFSVNIPASTAASTVFNASSVTYTVHLGYSGNYTLAVGISGGGGNVSGTATLLNTAILDIGGGTIKVNRIENGSLDEYIDIDASLSIDGGEFDFTGTIFRVTASGSSGLPGMMITSDAYINGAVTFGGSIQPLSASLPQYSNTSGYTSQQEIYPILMHGSFANDGVLNYMAPGDFMQRFVCKLIFNGTAATSVTLSDTAGAFEFVVVEINIGSSRYTTVACLAGHYTDWCAPVLSSGIWYMKGGVVRASGTNCALSDLRNFAVGTSTTLNAGLKTETNCTITRVWGIR